MKRQYSEDSIQKSEDSFLGYRLETIAYRLRILCEPADRSLK